MDLKSSLIFYKTVCNNYHPFETEYCPYNLTKEQCNNCYQCLTNFLDDYGIDKFIDISRKWQLMSFSFTHGVEIASTYEETYKNLRESRKRGEISIDDFFAARETLEKIGEWN